MSLVPEVLKEKEMDTSNEALDNTMSGSIVVDTKESDVTKETNSHHSQDEGVDIFQDVNYICSSTNIITGALQEGNDIAQLPSGDIVITEVKVVNTQYSWDDKKKKMVKIAQY